MFAVVHAHISVAFQCPAKTLACSRSRYLRTNRFVIVNSQTRPKSKGMAGLRIEATSQSTDLLQLVNIRRD